MLPSHPSHPFRPDSLYVALKEKGGEQSVPYNCRSSLEKRKKTSRRSRVCVNKSHHDHGDGHASSESNNRQTGELLRVYSSIKRTSQDAARHGAIDQKHTLEENEEEQERARKSKRAIETRACVFSLALGPCLMDIYLVAG